MTEWEQNELERQARVKAKYDNAPNQHLIGVLMGLKTGHTISLLNSREEYIDLLGGTKKIASK